MQLALASLIFLAAPAGDFVLTWHQKAVAGVPSLEEVFTVVGDQVSYSRLSPAPDTPLQAAIVKRPDAVRALVAKLPQRKTKGAAIEATYKTKGARTATTFAIALAEASGKEAQVWAALRDELRASLGLIPDTTPPAQSSVGVATLQANGDVWMRLYSGGEGTPTAESLKIVKQDDPKYGFYLEHVGGLKPGESKSIPPFD